METPLRVTRSGSLSALQQAEQWSTPREARTSLLQRNNKLVAELLATRESLQKRNREIATLRMELLTRAKTTKTSPDSTPPKRKRGKKSFVDVSTQTSTLSTLSPDAKEWLKENGNTSGLRSPSFSPHRFSSPIKARSRSSPMPVRSPLPKPPRFRGTDSLQFLMMNRSISSIAEREESREESFSVMEI